MEASELKNILKQHKIWLETNGVQGTCASLTGANLQGAYLGGANLQGAYLGDANLSGATLEGATLTDAYLGGANLTVANLSGANLTGAYFHGANLSDLNLHGANLTGADLEGADLSGAIGLPYVYWIIPGCLAQLNQFAYGFYLEKENKYENFVQDSFGFFIQDNSEEKTFDILAGDRVIRNIPDWIKYSGLKQIE